MKKLIGLVFLFPLLILLITIGGIVFGLLKDTVLWLLN